VLWRSREVVTAPGGALVASVLGYGLPPDGLQMPPLEAFLDPAFVWPDVRFAIECVAVYRSGSRRSPSWAAPPWSTSAG
jgi:hypothetical protein